MPATITDKLLIVPNLGLVIAYAILAALTGPFRGNEGAPTYKEHIVNTLIRSALTNLSIEQVQ